jgi:DNA-directed RNA polymerase specialized sigma24 family protein
LDAADLKLLTEFGDGGRRATEEIVDRMSPAIWRRVALHWRDLRGEAQDLQGESFAVLVRWLHEKRDFAKEPSLETLATRLVDQAARAMRWNRHRERAIADRLAHEPAPPEDPADDRSDGARLQGRLLALLDRLPRDQAHVIHAAARASAGGTPLDRVLRVGAEKARLRLARARLALIELARAEGFTLSNLSEEETGDD